MTAPSAVVSGDCAHEEWTAHAELIRDRDEGQGPIVAWSVEFTMACVECGAPMLWEGSAAIAVSPDRVEIMLPCQPHPPGVRS